MWVARKERQARDSDPLFVSPRGERLDYANLYHRILKPAMRKAGIPWGGAHRLRHTSATHLIRKGASANQAQLWLGHHDPGFTARTYVHLDADDLPDPAIFDSYFADRSDSRVPTHAPIHASSSAPARAPSVTGMTSESLPIGTSSDPAKPPTSSPTTAPSAANVIGSKLTAAESRGNNGATRPTDPARTAEPREALG